MMQVKKIASIAAMLLALAGAQAQSSAGSAKPKVVLVELFTSEGCSDCPPADALLRRINGSKTATGQLVVGISEHVTYWNRLGWTDPFSLDTFTDRQNGYGASLGLDSVYTPQMVVNGREQFVGSDRNSLERALLREQSQVQLADVRIAAATLEGGSLKINFFADGDKLVRGADVMAVLTDDLDESNVLRGENSGRALAHVAVARAMAKVGKVQSGEQQTARLPLPSSFYARHGHLLVLFVQTRGQGGVLGADSVALD